MLFLRIYGVLQVGAFRADAAQWRNAMQRDDEVQCEIGEGVYCAYYP